MSFLAKMYWLALFLFKEEEGIGIKVTLNCIIQYVLQWSSDYPQNSTTPLSCTNKQHKGQGVGGRGKIQSGLKIAFHLDFKFRL